MPTVSGRVVFDRDRTASISVGDTGITNVPIVIQNTATNVGTAVLTDSNGDFVFTNVPAGSYRLVEAWGASGNPTPIDFSIFATTIAQPTPNDPPISQVLLTTTVPTGANGLDSLSPNTLFVTVSTTTITNQNFLDGPFKDVPVNFQNTINLGPNLINQGGKGIFGTIPAGSAINSYANPNPYPGIAPAFTYFPSIPGPASSYTFVNIFTQFPSAWWNTTDHTVGDETGRFMLINGGSAGQTFFTDTVPVSPNTNYLFSTWMLNLLLVAGAPPVLGIQIENTSGGVIFSAPVITIPASSSILTWNEVGTIFNSKANTSVVVKFISRSSLAGGNDFVIDDVSLRDVSFNQLLTVKKLVDKVNAIVGETLNYTLVIQNKFTTDAQKIVILDTIPNGTNFVVGSVNVDGVTLPSANPGSSFTIPNILGGNTSTITFQVQVATLPIPNPIPNSANATYEFFAVPLQATVPQSTNSNIVNTFVDAVALRSQKSADIEYVDIGDTIKYTIGLKLVGVITIANVNFIDTIPNGTSFVNNSFTFNGVTIPGANPSPPSGVDLGTIPANALSTVTFEVTVVTKPNPNPIKNNSYTKFTYTTDPSFPNANRGDSPSNTTNDPIFSFVDLEMIKSADFSFIQSSTTITYTILLRNNGTADAKNIILVDTIPIGTAYIPNTFKMNGVTIPGANPSPPTGVNIGTIPSQSQSIVSFEVFAPTLPNGTQITNVSSSGFVYSITPTGPNTSSGTGNSNTSVTEVTTLPLQSTIPNYASYTFNYTVDPSLPDISNGGNTNTIDNFLNTADLLLVKNAINYADVGDTIIYTITIANTGTTTANNVIFSDTIPNNTTFVPGSFEVNGVATIANPNPPGINIGVVGVGQVSTVTFEVVVDTIPSPNHIKNSAKALFLYTVDPSSPNSANGSSNSNINLVTVSRAILSMTKTNTPTYVDIGTTVTYTVCLNNIGNTSATNVVFIDTIPNDTNFVNGSFSINNATISGSPHPPGINIGTIPVGITTVSFKVVVITIPSPNPIPNSATTTFNYTVDPSIPNSGTGSSNSNTNHVNVTYANLVMNKVSNPLYAQLGSTVSYTILVNNNGNTSATNTVFIDTIPNGTSFVNGSFSINGATISGSPNPPGINIGTLPVGITTLSFNVTVDTMPTPNPIPNSSTTNFNYTVDPSIPNGSTRNSNSNTAYTQVNQAKFALAKSVDKSYAICSDILTYTFRITNLGNVAAANVIFRDTIPDGTQFISNSFTLDGVTISGANPTTGVNLNTISAGSTSTVTFKVIIIC